MNLLCIYLISNKSCVNEFTEVVLDSVEMLEESELVSVSLRKLNCELVRLEFGDLHLDVNAIVFSQNACFGLVLSISNCQFGSFCFNEVYQSLKNNIWLSFCEEFSVL